MNNKCFNAIERIGHIKTAGDWNKILRRAEICRGDAAEDLFEISAFWIMEISGITLEKRK
jgi:hypothetical protein